MSLSFFTKNPDHESKELDEEAALSFINLSSRSSFKPLHSRNADLIISWKKIFFAAAAIILLGTVAYYIRAGLDQQVNQVLIAQREKMVNLGEEIKEKLKRLA